ncbi:MAG: hypothetical protein ABIR03_10115 [Ginsengibacter sp.]
MKKTIIILFLLPVCFHVKAQSNDENTEGKKGFQKEKLFTGGSANLGFSNGTTMLGITPQFGYSLTDWADAGITFNLNYISQRDYNSLDKIRQTTYGPGAFVRLFPLNFLFGTAQYEYNIIRQKYIQGSGGSSPIVDRVNASSLLVGGGYAGGRYKGSNTYYYISVMLDIMGDTYSPYVDGLGRSNPVIRAGYNIGLFQGRRK